MELQKTEVNTKDLAPLKFPKIHPETAARDYLHSKSTNSVIKKCPDWDVPRSDPAADLVVRKREFYDAEVRLTAKKNDSVKKRHEVNELWRDLEERENTLRTNFIKFNKFVKENQEKRERAERKIAEERVLFEKRHADIEKLEEKFEFMSEIHSKMETNIKSHRMYEDFLLGVIKDFPIFRTIDSILDRYEALAEARKVLADRQEEDLSALEEAKTHMIKLTEEKTLAVMGLYNVMAELQSRYEVAKNKALHWETMVVRVNNTLVTKLAELQDIRQSCWTVYLGMCKRKEIEGTVAEHDIENQLLFIKSTLGELKRITRIAARRALLKSKTASSAKS